MLEMACRRGFLPRLSLSKGFRRQRKTMLCLAPQTLLLCTGGAASNLASSLPARDMALRA